ncbi:hypothetical protein Agub_g9182, partial [Astrephomene gubernaculifera]
ARSSPAAAACPAGPDLSRHERELPSSESLLPSCVTEPNSACAREQDPSGPPDGTAVPSSVVTTCSGALNPTRPAPSPAVPPATASASVAEAAANTGGGAPVVPPSSPQPPLPPPTAPRSPGCESVSSSVDDAALYAEFYGEESRLPPPLPPPTKPVSTTDASLLTSSSPSSPPLARSPTASAPSSSSAAAAVNAPKVDAAFAPTGGTASREGGFSFTAPDLPPPPPLPPGLPPVAAPIDCRYLSVANRLRVSAHATTAAMAELLGLRQRPSQAAEQRKTDRVNQILQNVADTLQAYGYAVLDNYISEEAVQLARKELRVMEPHYSPGMIWVGKETEVGAQISVSAVRGDVVLWLDDTALGATAFVKDGVRRKCSFIQLQQLLADVDELVFEGLRPRLPYLAGL